MKKRHPIVLIHKQSILIRWWIRKGKSLDYLKKWLGLNLVNPLSGKNYE